MKRFLYILLIILCCFIGNTVAFTLNVKAYDVSGKSFDSAIPIQLGNEVTGQMKSLDDKHYYTFTTSNSGKYYIKTSFFSSYIK